MNLEDLPVHPAADLFPMLPDDECRELGEHIKAHGLNLLPVTWEDPETGTVYLIDGRNRIRAMEMAGIEIPAAHGYANGDPFDYVLDANVYRRHLTAEQRRALIARVLKARPERSDRQIAKQVGVSHPTVAKERKEAEARGDVERVSTRTDTKGRKQPTQKAKPKRVDAADESLDAVPTPKAPSTSTVPRDPKPLNERWAAWATRMNTVMLDGAKLAAETGDADDLGGHAGFAYMIYRRIVERHLDAEIRNLMDSSAETRGYSTPDRPATRAKLPYGHLHYVRAGDAVEFQEAKGKRWQPATVTKIVSTSEVEIKLASSGNLRTPGLDKLRLPPRKRTTS